MVKGLCHQEDIDILMCVHQTKELQIYAKQKLTELEDRQTHTFLSQPLTEQLHRNKQCEWLRRAQQYHQPIGFNQYL